MAAYRKFTDEILALIEELAEQNIYTQDICLKINEIFGTNFTKNQVKMCMYRYGISNGMQHRSCIYTKLFPKEVCDYIEDKAYGIRTRELMKMVNSTFNKNYTINRIRSFIKNHHLRTGFKDKTNFIEA